MVNTCYVPNNLVGFSISLDCEISCVMDSLRNANGLVSGFDPLSIANVPNIDLGCFSKYLQHVLSRWLVGMQSKRRQEKKHCYVGGDSTSSLPNTGAWHRIVASCSFVILRFYVTNQLRSNSWHTSSSETLFRLAENLDGTKTCTCWLSLVSHFLCGCRALGLFKERRVYCGLQTHQ